MALNWENGVHRSISQLFTSTLINKQNHLRAVLMGARSVDPFSSFLATKRDRDLVAVILRKNNFFPKSSSIYSASKPVVDILMIVFVRLLNRTRILRSFAVAKVSKVLGFKSHLSDRVLCCGFH